jgi:large subunit ribosomal protein L32e
MKKFIRKDANKKKRIANTGWRKPKGITNKKRLNRKGHSANVRPGYGTPNNEKNTQKGLEIITITNIEQLETVNPKTQCIVIGRAGKQKKLDMIKKAEEKKIFIVNLKVEQFKQEAEKFFKEREKATKQRTEEQKKKEAELKQAEEEKQAEKKKAEIKETEEVSPEEQKKQEKQEKDKILTKK